MQSRSIQTAEKAAVGAELGSGSGSGGLHKTFIGRIEKGFDFLGYHFGPQGVRMAQKTITAFVERALRLYEQEAGGASGPSRFGAYVRRWVGWARSGVARRPPDGAPRNQVKRNGINRFTCQVKLVPRSSAIVKA